VKLFAGLSRTDYQDLLRAIGAYIDAERLQDVRIWEHADGMVLQGSRASMGPEDDTYQTILLTDEDLQAMLQDAYRRREGGD
jgi:hypothetical protein